MGSNRSKTAPGSLLEIHEQEEEEIVGEFETTTVDEDQPSVAVRRQRPRRNTRPPKRFQNYVAVRL